MLFFSIIERSVLMIYNGLSLQRYVRKGSDANNLAILSFSLICYRKILLNAAHARLLEKLTPIAIQSLEYQ